MRAPSLRVGLGVSLLALAGTFAFPLISSAAPPEVVKIALSTTVNTNYYIVTPNSGWCPSQTTALFVMAGASTGTTTTAAPSFGAPTNVTYVAGSSPMFGDHNAYGMILMAFTSSDLGASMGTNLPTNKNPGMFGGATGPVNKNVISMNSAIATGTSVTVTLDMKSNIPQLVAVMSGSYPTVTYDSSAYGGSGRLTIQTLTTDTVTNAGDSMNSILGFMLMCNTTLGNNPLREVTQSDTWVGDIFPQFPGFDANSQLGSGSSGVLGNKFTARCGTTYWGGTGLNRKLNVFLPEASVTAMFGTSCFASEVRGYIGSSQQDSSLTTTGVTNFGVTGILFSHSFTFASPKDVSLGVPSAAADAVSSSSSGVCFLSAARRR